MSTPETTERPHTRRRQLTVASVAAAVVLAGGGGAYWASNATEPSGGTAQASDGRTDPPPLILDSLGLSESGDTDRGIAPGEPNPNGTVYEAEGELPEGPGAAAVHRPDGDLTRSEVQAIAKVFEVPGTPEWHEGRWQVDDLKDGAGPVLTVDGSHGGASWSYVVRYRPSDDLCGKPKDGGFRTLPAPCPDGSARSHSPQGGQVDPVSAQEAKKALRPALEALHLHNAELDASSTNGSRRVVTAQPHADGLPVQDWSSIFTVGSRGQVLSGHGHLGDLVQGAEYPVMTAAETLEELNKHDGGQPQAPFCDAGPPAEPQHGGAEIGGYPKADDIVACAPPGAADPGENTAAVTDATFGLAAEYAKGKPVLVPAWIFQVRQQGGEGAYEVSFPAVEPEFLRIPREGGGTGGGDTPVAPDGDSGATISYTVDGRELTVTFWGGVCHDYRATAKDRGGKVAITVEAKNADSKKPCILIAKKQQVTVELDRPLDGREVVDARTGEELPEKR